MHRFFIPQPYSDTMTIMGVDARHIYTVLRMQCGSRVQIVSDDGVTALAEIADANESVVTVKCLEVLAESHEPSVRIVLAQGLAKGEKMDFIIQKAVELGVSEIIPVAMEYAWTVIKLLRKPSAGRKLLKRLRNRVSVILYQWCSQYRRWNRCLLIIPVTVN